MRSLSSSIKLSLDGSMTINERLETLNYSQMRLHQIKSPKHSTANNPGEQTAYINRRESLLAIHMTELIQIIL